MGDRATAEIWIGGRVKRSFVPKLCKAICAEHVELNWGMGPTFEPHNEAELMEGIDDYCGTPALHLLKAQASFGEFGRLEEFLRRHKLPYTRQRGSSDSLDAIVVDFRPEDRRMEFVTMTDSDGAPVIFDVDRVEKALDLIKEAQRLMQRRKSGRGTIAEVADLLDRALPPRVPRLTPFEIAR